MKQERGNVGIDGGVVRGGGGPPPPLCNLPEALWALVGGFLPVAGQLAVASVDSANNARLRCDYHSPLVISALTAAARARRAFMIQMGTFTVLKVTRDGLLTVSLCGFFGRLSIVLWEKSMWDIKSWKVDARKGTIHLYHYETFGGYYSAATRARSLSSTVLKFKRTQNAANTSLHLLRHAWGHQLAKEKRNAWDGMGMMRRPRDGFVAAEVDDHLVRWRGF